MIIFIVTHLKSVCTVQLRLKHTKWQKTESVKAAIKKEKILDNKEIDHLQKRINESLKRFVFAKGFTRDRFERVAREEGAANMHRRG